MALPDDSPGQIIPNQDEDPFISLLGLEDKFYQEGHAEGVSDGARAGFIEGRVFGIEKGFEKYLAIGRLHGHAAVWAGRLQKHQPPPAGGRQLASPSTMASDGEPNKQRSGMAQGLASSPCPRLPNLPANPRLEKHIRTLYALTEPASLSTENTEDSVSDFDDRLKRALAKVKVIEKLIGESDLGRDGDSGLPEEQRWNKGKGGGDGSIEDVDILRVRH